MTDRLRCLVVDGQPVARLGVRGVLGDRYDIEEVESGEEALDLVTGIGAVDVIVLDMRAAGGAVPGRAPTGIATIRALMKAQPSLCIVAYAEGGGRALVSEALRAGAKGYVLKSSPLEQLSLAVDAAADGQTFADPALSPARDGAAVTRRQREILQLLADGNSTVTVAKRLDLSSETVKTHTKHLLARLGARDRAHAVAIAMRNNLIE